METPITKPKREWLALERKAKAGWKSFFLLKERYDILSSQIMLLDFENSILNTEIQKYTNVNEDLNHLTNQYKEMYKDLKKMIECPVCYETLTEKNMSVPSCGHIICNNCKKNIIDKHNSKCPICKKKYFI